MPETVHLAVYDTMADWEPGHAIAEINAASWQREPGRFQVRTVAATSQPVRTMAGVRILPDLSLEQVAPSDSAMLILPGDATWGNGGNREMARKASEFLDAGVPVAAICGATYGLALAGLLDNRMHTSNAPEYLAMSGYAGGSLYRDEPAVTDRGLITAGAMFAVDFARAIFATLEVFTDEVLDAWYRLYRHGDGSAYHVLAAAADSVARTDVSGTDVSGSDVSGSDVSGSDVSGTDVSETSVAGASVAAASVADTSVAGRHSSARAR